MYLAHFGLREYPFSLTPDTTYFFDADPHRDALNVLLAGLRCGDGFERSARSRPCSTSRCSRRSSLDSGRSPR